ncbi:Trk system potassium transporter TrkA [Clostridium sp. AM58-1XD]|uniref:Trk system potassium transporter TrkA n=1 Tax=Clostridium sp. AM58-1XD TaxID=2292307 RepID=UPI000E4A684F|nr:Trk system potassium transporter TrkA [Clostridium sp. AM58-1XD]RGY95865.1 Trk system potassium transporter TrkA [Clostridium sp. AM58-1XD]
MRIVIIGCGKVGMTLAEQLCDEHQDVVIIDSSLRRMQEIPENIDAMRIVGNGSSIQTQLEAGVDQADILIAVTGSDELNLLCCLIAKKAGDCQTIARVRNPVYSKEIGFIKERLGVSMVINPELAAATEIARLLRFPSAIKIDTFAKGRVELLKFKIRKEFGLNDVAVSGLQDKLKSNVLVAAVERDEDVYIPNGDFILKDGDSISLIASPQNASEFFHAIGLKTNQVRNCMIVGGGKIAYYLARQLIEMKITVRIIEKELERCEQLSELLPEAMIVNGDGTDKKLLLEEGLQRAEGFVTMTNMDEENILLTLFAKDQSTAKLVTKVNRIAFDDIIERLDIGSVIYPKYITADYILQYVRAMHNSIGSNVETLYQILDNRAEALEFSIREKSQVTGIPLMNLTLKDNLLIGCIHRKGRIMIPRGHDCIEVGDTVIIVTTQKGLHDIQDVMKK